MDMLVKLYTLPPPAPAVAALETQDIRLHRALTADTDRILDWVREQFEPGWAGECAAALHRTPVTCHIARHGRTIAGFACHDATAPNFFGPTGVAAAYRGRGIGRALLLASLHDMAAHGYAYAIIGGVGPAEFYEKAVGAMPIPDSEPGIYGRLLENTP